MREAVYGDLLPDERVDVHGAIARALEEDGGGALAAERAHHWEAAGEPRAAVLAAIEAGIAAEQAYAYREALAHFERVALLWPPGSTEIEGAQLDQIGVRARAAEAARVVGDPHRAQALCRDALAMFDHQSDPLRAAELFERLGRNENWNVGAFQQALELLSERDVHLWMRVKIDIALAMNGANRWQEARASAADALRLAGEPGTEALESMARAELGFADAFLGDLSGAETQLREALRLIERAGDAEQIRQVMMNLGEVLRLQGRVADALAVMLEGERLADRFGASGNHNFLIANASDDLLRMGRWDEAEAHLRRLLGSLLLAPATELLLVSVDGRLCTARGHFDRAGASLDRALVLLEEIGYLEYVPAVYAGYAELDLWNGRIGRALERVTAGLERIKDVEDALYAPALYSVAARAEADRAEHARSAGRQDEADRAVAAVSGLCDQLAAVLARARYGVRPPEAEAHLANCRAELARAAATLAADRWGAAGELWGERECPYATAYALYRQGEALLAQRGGRELAGRILADADRLCAELQAQPLRDALRGLAQRARLKLAEEPQRDRSDGAASVRGSQVSELGLTAREVEVLALLAAGQTNREISAALYISPHTTAAHLSHIFAKLDVPNRVMAAAAAQRLGLLAAHHGELPACS